jgi:dinuclear metal center YbgI/SA1388 family protein
MKMSQLMVASEALVPLHVAESWDNVGLLMGDPASDVTRVMLTIDLTEAVLAEALEQRCDAVMAYHPPIFAGLKRITAGSVVYQAIRAGLCVYSQHTALDIAVGGTNDVLADALGLLERGPLRPLKEDATRGQGRVGTVSPTTLGALAARLKKELALHTVLMAGPQDHPVTRVALCAGAGGELLEDALKAHAHVFVTGEMRHHDALKALTRGCAVLMTLHSNSERRTLPILAARLSGVCPGVTLMVSSRDQDPFQFV